MKKAKWIIQSTGVRRNLQNEEWFSREVDFIDFGFIDSTNEITNLISIYEDWLENKNNAYIVRGSTKILRVFHTEAINDNLEFLKRVYPGDNFHEFFHSLHDGIFYDYDKFDQAYYLGLDLPLLNKEAIIINAEKARYKQFSEPKFVKPSSDGKSFTGNILFPGESIGQLILSMPHHERVWDETILISPEKKVLKEWRFFILDGEVITGSQYHERHKVKVKPLDKSNEDLAAISCAKEYAKLYQPAELFTLDICLEEDNKWSIVEYNCFNCSGLYESNKEVLQKEVENFVINR